MGGSFQVGCATIHTMPHKDKEKYKAYRRIYEKSPKYIQRRRLYDRGRSLKRRLKVIQLFGGECQKCGYNANIWALQIDHIQPLLRGLDQINSTSHIWRDVANGSKSLDGLQLLCANCHAIKTFDDRQQYSHWTSSPPAAPEDLRGLP